MGRVAKFLTGLFILGAGVAVNALRTYASSIEGAPVDYGALVGFASSGLLLLGGVIVGYALLSTVFAIIKHNYQKRKRIQQEEEARRREQAPAQDQGYGRGNQQAGGQQQQQQQRQQPRGQRRRQQQQGQRRRRQQEQNRQNR